MRSTPRNPIRRSARAATLAALAGALVLTSCGSSDSARPVPRLHLNPGGSGGDGAKADAAALYPVRPITYRLDGTLADLGADAPVRRLVGVPVAAADVAKLADALGLSGTATKTDTGYEVRDGSAGLFVDTTGVTTVAYAPTSDAGSGGGSSPGSTGSAGTGTASDAPAAVPGAEPGAVKPLPPDGTVTDPTTTLPAPVDVPSPSEAEAAAADLLDAMGVLGDLRWRHEVVDDGATSVGVCSSDGPCEPGPDLPAYSRTVRYTLELDGMPVPGLDWMVTIGQRGRIDSVFGSWFTIEDAGTFPLRSTGDVFADLQAGRAQFVGPQALMASGAMATAKSEASGGAAAGSGGQVEPDGPVAEPPADATTVPDPATTPTEPAVLPPAPPGSTSTEPIDTTTTEAPEPLVVTVTGVSRGLALWSGTEDGKPVAYIVPTYRFRAVAEGGDPYDIEVLALARGAVTLSEPPVPEDAPARQDEGSGTHTS